MIDTDAFVRSSPYQLSHSETADKFNLNNTTSELLKFQLQEQYRATLNDLKTTDANTTTNSTDHESSFLHSQVMQDSFNNALQSQIEAGEIHLSNSTGNLSSTSTTTSTYVGDDNKHTQLGNGVAGEDDDEDDDNLDSFISTKFNKPNYLNLKILIENSIFDSTKIKSSILDFHALNEAKAAIENKLELQKYLLSKISTAQNFNNMIVHEQNVDNSLLVKIIKTQSSLQSQLIETSTELEALKEKLSNHYFSCLSLGYIEDIRVSRNLQSTSTIQQSPMNSPGKIPNNITSPHFSLQLQQQQNFDSLIAHVASVAAQRNISLPQPPLTETPDSKITWIQQCIDSILSNSTPSQEAESLAEQSFASKKSLDVGSIRSNPTSPMRSLGPDKMVYEYKTALNDLRFSYEYLAKEYEMSRISSDKMIHEYRKKIAELEKEVQMSRTDLMTPPTTGSFGSDSNSLGVKDKEISRLRKELNLLKVEKLGKPFNNAHYNNSTGSFLTSPNVEFSNSAISPITGESLHLPIDSSILHDDEEDAHSVNSHGGRPLSSSGFSNGILRKEFKKIVSDIQDQYELELAEERVRRRKLEDELEKHRS
ncbi:hypothetical protein Cantr_10006 [Candida viswanathii]|uniref:Protein PEA2 n=1 Tax=Candida viswanathii TaxID=5486 RepID=A0A367YBH2_9ASCO|nr:hypothetical protein Cantr_10006 [Candida viswanathii]